MKSIDLDKLKNLSIVSAGDDEYSIESELGTLGGTYHYNQAVAIKHWAAEMAAQLEKVVFFPDFSENPSAA